MVCSKYSFHCRYRPFLADAITKGIICTKNYHSLHITNCRRITSMVKLAKTGKYLTACTDLHSLEAEKTKYSSNKLQLTNQLYDVAKIRNKSSSLI